MRKHFDDLTPEDQDKLGKYDYCRSCQYLDDSVTGRYSFGIYAGILCDDCAKSKYRDQCGLGEDGQGSQAELEEMGEVIEEP